MTIQDRMTSRLNKITQAYNKATKAAKAADAATKGIDPGAGFDKAAPPIDKASKKVKEFNQKQKESATGAEKVKSAWSGVGGYIKSAVGIATLKNLIGLADSMTTIRARLDLMNDGLQTTEELQQQIMASANRSRASYQATANAVSKMGIMATDAFSNNQELIQFTEKYNVDITRLIKMNKLKIKL